MESSNHIVKMDREEFIEDIEAAEARGGFSALIRSYEIHARRADDQDDVEYLLNDLVERLVAASEQLANPIVSAGYLERAGEVCVALLDAPERALALFHSAFKKAPSAEGIQRAHALLVGKLAPQKMLPLVEARWKTSSGALKADFGVAFARSLIGAGAVGHADAILSEVLGLFPEHSPAAQLQARIARGGDDAAKEMTLDEALHSAKTDQERAEILVEAGDAFEVSSELALDMYRRSFAAFPTTNNVSRLVAHFDGRDDVDSKLNMYREVLSTSDSRDLLLEARLALGHSAPPEEALEHLLWIREYEPRAPSILLPLAEVNRKLGDVKSLIDVLIELRSSTRIVSEAREIDREIGLLCWKELGDLDKAEPYFRKWRTQEPSAEPVKAFFTELARAREDWVSLLRSLRKSLGDVDVTEQAPILREIASVTREQLGSADGALDALEKLWRIQPSDHGAFDEMVEILTSTQKWTRLAALLEEGAELARESSNQERELGIIRQFVALTSESGPYPVQTLHERARDRLLELDAPDEASLVELLEGYRAMGATGKQIKTLEGLLGIIEEEARRAPLLYELGHTLAGVEGRSQEAIPVLESYLETQDVEDHDVRQLLNQLYRTKRDVGALLESLRAEISSLSGEARFSRMRELAFLLEGESGDLRGAASVLVELVDEGVASREERRHLRRLLEEIGDWAKLGAMLVEEGRGEGSKSLRIAAFEKAGRVYLEELGDYDRAREAFVELLALSPFHGEAKSRLAELRGEDGDWSSLRSMYEESGDWSGYLRILADAESEESDPSRKGDVLVELANVLENELNQGDAAIAQYAKVLGLDPGRLDVARILVERYAGANEREALAAALELIALYSTEASEIRSAMARLVVLCEEMDNAVDALDWAGRLLEISARDGNLEPWIQVTRLGEVTGDYEVVADALELGLREFSGAEEEATDLQLALGDLLWRRLQRGDDAAEWFERVLDEEPSSSGALDGLQEIATVGGDWSRLERVLRLRGEHEAGERERLAAREQLGDLYDTIFDEPERALEAYRRALEISPGSPLALEGAIRILQQEGKRSELKHLLEQAIPELEGTEHATRTFQLGELCRGEEEGEIVAIEHYLACLRGDPAHGGAIAALEEMTRQEVGRREAFQALEEVCRSSKNWLGLAKALEGKVALAESGEMDRNVLGELAHLYVTQLDEPGKALPVLKNLVGAEPENLELLDRWIDAGRATGNLAEIVAYFEGKPDRKDWEWIERVSRVHEATGDLKSAAQVLEGVEEQQAVHLLYRKAEVFEAQGEWDSAYDALMEAAELQEDAEPRVQLFSRSANMAFGAGELGLERGIAALVMAAEIEGASGECAEHLRSIYVREGRGESFLELERGFLKDERTERGVSLHLLERMALEAVHWMERPSAAVEAYTEWFKRAIEEPIPEGVDHLCREGRPESVDVDAWQGLLRLGAEYAHSIRDWDRELLFREGELVFMELPERGQALMQMARRASEDLCVAETALHYVEQALDSGVRDEVSLRLGYQLASELDQMGSFFELLDARIRQQSDLSEPILRMAAELASNVLDRPDVAAEHYRTLLTIDCDEVEVLAVLDKALTDAGEDVERLAVIARRAELAEGEEQSFMYQALASLSMLLGERTLAVASWEEVKKHPDTDEQSVHLALVQLTDLYKDAGRSEALMDVLKHRSDHDLETENRADLLLRAGRICADELNQPVEAAALFERTLERTPGIQGPWLELERAYRDAELWEQLEHLYLRKVEMLELGDEWARVKRALIGLYEEQLKNAEMLFSTVEELIQHEPMGPAVEQWVRPLLDEGGDLGTGSFEILKRYYEENSESEEWRELMLEALTLDIGHERHQKIHLELAEMFEAEERDLPGAWGHYLRAWEIDLGDTLVWGELVRVTELLEGWDGLKDAIDEAASTLEDFETKGLVLERASRVFDEDAGLPGIAALFLEEYREESVPKMHILSELERLYEEAEDWASVIRILQDQIELEDSPEEGQVIRLSLARLLDDRMNDQDAALDELQRLIKENPGLLEAREFNEEILLREPHAEDLVRFYESWLTWVSGNESDEMDISGRLLHWLRASGEHSARTIEVACWRIERARLDEAAVMALESGLVEGGDIEVIGAKLLGVYEESGRWENLLQLLQIWGDRREDVSGRIDLYEQAYHVATRKLSDATQGLSIALRFVELGGGTEWLSKGEEHARETGDWEHWLQGLIDVSGRMDNEEAFALRGHVLLQARDIGEESPSYRQCLELMAEAQDASPEVLNELDELLRSQEDWEALLSLLEVRANRSDEPARKAEYFLESADVALLEMEEPRRGAQYFERILALEPKHLEALERMSGVLAELEEWERLANHYRHWVGVTSNAQNRSALRLRRAAICLDPLDWWTDAAQEALLALEESGESGGAVELLTGMLEGVDPRATLSDGRSARRTIAEAIYPYVAEEGEGWARRSLVLLALLETSDDSQEQAKLLRLYGLGTWKEAGDPQGGYSRLCASLYRYMDFALLEDALECAEIAEMQVEFRDLLSELSERHGGEREALLMRAAAYSLFPLRDGVAAAAFYEQVLARNPSNGDALDALEAYHREAGQLKGVKSVLRKRLALHESAERRGDYWLELGDLELEGGEPEKAIAAYEEARRCQPESALILRSLEPLYRNKNDWTSLEQVLRKQIEISSDEEVSYEMLLGLGDMLSQDAGQDARAREVYLKAATLRDTSLEPLTRLASIYRKQTRWSALVKVLEQSQALMAPGEERAATTVEIGRIYAEKLAAVEQGMEQFRLALTEYPESQDALIALQALLADEHHQLPAALFLDTHYESQGRYEELLTVLEIQRAHAGGAEEVFSITERLSAVLEEELLAPEKAMEALVEGLRGGVSFEAVQPGLSRLASEHGMWPETLHALSYASDGMSDGGLFVLQWCAAAWEEKLSNPEESSLLLEKCWNLAPGDRSVFQRLTDSLERQGQWAELADVLERDCRLAPTGENRLRLGRVLKDGLKDPAGAFDVLKRVLLDGDGERECEEELEVLAWEYPEIRGRVVELLRPVFEARRDREGEMRLLDLMSETDDVGRAEALWEGGNLAVSSFEDKEGGLTRMLASIRIADRVDGSRLNTVIELARELSRIEETIEVLECLVGDGGPAEDSIEVISKLGRLFLEVGDQDRAESTLESLLRIDDSHPATLSTLRELYLASNRLEELRNVCAKELRGSVTLEHRGELLGLVAEASVSLGDTKGAITALEELQGLDLAGVSELETLALLYEGTGMESFLLMTLERLALHPGLSSGRARDVKLRLASLEEAHGADGGRAIRWYEDILEIEPGHWEALTSLERLYRARQEWDGLADVIGRLASETEARVRKVELWKERAQLLEDRLGRLDSAEDSLTQALMIEPGDEDAVNSLVRLYHKRGKWSELFGLYETKLENMARGQSWNELALKAVEVAVDGLQRPERALELLSELIRESEPATDILLIYGKLTLQQGDAGKAGELFQKGLDVAVTDDERVEALVALGGMAVDRGDGHREAMEFLLQAVALSPYHSGVNERLSQVYRVRGRWDALVGVLKRQLEGLQSAGDRADMCMQIARVYVDSLEQPELALPFLEQSYSLVPENDESLRMMVDILGGREEYMALLPLIREWVSRLRDKKQYESLGSYAFMLGKTEEACGSVEAAEGAYRLAYRRDPAHVETLVRLSTLLLEQGANQEALPILQALQLRQQHLNGAQKVFVFYALAQVWANDGDKRRAIQFLRRTLKVDPSHAEANALLERLQNEN